MYLLRDPEGFVSLGHPFEIVLVHECSIFLFAKQQSSYEIIILNSLQELKIFLYSKCSSSLILFNVLFLLKLLKVVNYVTQWNLFSFFLFCFSDAVPLLNKTNSEHMFETMTMELEQLMAKVSKNFLFLDQELFCFCFFGWGSYKSLITKLTISQSLCIYFLIVNFFCLNFCLI